MLTFNELIIYALFKWGVGDDPSKAIEEWVPNCEKIVSQVDQSRAAPQLYARLLKYSEFGLDEPELKLYTYTSFYTYGTYVKHGHKQDGNVRKIKMIVYSLQGKKLKTKTWIPK